MLAALQITAFAPKSIRRGKRSGVLRPGEVGAAFVAVEHIRFLRITAMRDKRGALDWDNIRRMAGGEAGQMLLPQGLCPPPEARIRPFCGHALRRDLMAITGIQLLRITSLSPRQLRIGLYDPAGRYPQMAVRFLPYAADVRVVTHRPEAYAIQARLAMQQFGATIPVSPNTDLLGGVALILAPDGIAGWRAHTRGLILSGAPEAMPGVVNGYVPQASAACLSALPAGCDAWEFLAGLYERSGMRALAQLPPSLLVRDGNPFSLRDAAWKVALAAEL